MDEINSLKEKQNILMQNSSLRSPSQEIMVETTKCEQCSTLKTKIDSFHNTFDKFTIGRDNLNLLLDNQRASYNKVDLD